MGEAGPYCPATGAGPPLTDVRELRLTELLDTDDSVLATALRQVLRDLEQPGESYAAHGNAP